MRKVTRDGKHLSLDGGAFRVRGVTYGSFARRLDGALFPDRPQIKADLTAMADLGLNTVRTYSLPPPEVLDIAEELGLRLFVGLDYHDWRMETSTGRAAQRRILNAGRRAVDEAMELCAGRSSVLTLAIGNEVPSDLVRLHAITAVEQTLSALVAHAHQADPGLLVTYVNYPTTEYLKVEGQDLVCFNVFLEEEKPLEQYLQHLQVISGDLPVLITELGLASELHGDDAQAESLAWQLRTVDEAGCAGATVYSWTDDWAVDDQPVEGWGFGVTTRDREPKPSVAVLEAWARSRSPHELRTSWPRISLVVCAYNEEDTIEECLRSLESCDYPELEVLVCDDGSIDRTLELARRFPFKVLELPHGGLSRARNAGLEAATGEIVAYLDADAACHPDWPYYIALSLEQAVVATGGPNPPFEDIGLVERAVAASPGRPMEVLITDDRAEHVPGCNMAFRKGALQAIGGFNPLYRAAGDDVDVCWKLLDQGDEIGFAPAAQVRHHRRATILGYLRQQRGYGRAERMLSGPHRHRFNRLGQARWAGFVYGSAGLLPWLFRPVVYHGYYGSSPYQPVQLRRAELAQTWVSALLPLTAPIFLVGLLLALASPWFLGISAVSLLITIAYGLNVAAVVVPYPNESWPLRFRLVTALLHVLQPFARMWGRITGRSAGPPLPNGHPWDGDRESWISGLQRELEVEGCTVRAAGPGEAWDLEAASGPFVKARLTTAIAWHWEPRIRVDYRPRKLWWMSLAVAPAVAAAAWLPAVLVGGIAVLGLWADRRILTTKVATSIRATTEGALV